MSISSDKTRVMISLEKELVEYIRNMAKKNGRSMSNEIAVRFENLKVSEEAIKKE